MQKSFDLVILQIFQWNLKIMQFIIDLKFIIEFNSKLAKISRFKCGVSAEERIKVSDSLIIRNV